MATQIDQNKIMDNGINLPPNKEILYQTLDVFKKAMTNANSKGVFRILTAHQINVGLKLTKEIFDKLSETIYSKDNKKSSKGLALPQIDVLIRVKALFHEALEDASTKGTFTSLDASSEAFEAYFTISQIFDGLISSLQKQESLEVQINELEESSGKSTTNTV